MIESGTEVKGTKVETSRDSPMRENVTYEFLYSVTKVPFPGFLEALRGFILSMWTTLMGRFTGLTVIYWTLDDIQGKFLWQGKGISTSIWEEIALGTVAIACQGILIVAGIATSLKAIFEFTSEVPEPVKKYGTWIALGGLGALGLLLFWLGKKTT
ncbi:MAG: hypothetical protein HWN68_14540 [Desulfobacterales bacterium]|nr:hypothetical protein [Desulfobacterales bacterium]